MPLLTSNKHPALGDMAHLLEQCQIETLTSCLNERLGACQPSDYHMSCFRHPSFTNLGISSLICTTYVPPTNETRRRSNHSFHIALRSPCLSYLGCEIFAAIGYLSEPDPQVLPHSIRGHLHVPTKERRRYPSCQKRGMTLCNITG